MLVGLDFDNTIVCYDRLFHRLALERGLISAQVPATKTAVRDAIRAAGREDEWTELQGVGYGPRIVDAEPFAGVLEFLSACTAAGVRVIIVSHKTRTPFRGPAYDLHDAAHNFLSKYGFYETSHTGLSRESVHLEPTLAAKLARIGQLGCDLFMDDLPELLHEAAFPRQVRKVLFDPASAYRDHPSYRKVDSWRQLTESILGAGVVR